jgi:hypothetical protein
MTEPDVRRILADVVPDLPEPVDRLAEVRLRAQRSGRGRRALVAGAAVAVVAALAVAIPTWPRSDPAETFTGVKGVTCPAIEETAPGPGSAGRVVPEGAERATLCVYLPDLDDWRMGPSATLTAGVADVVDSLDALPDHDARAGSCLLSLGPRYSVAFDYPDGARRWVLFSVECSTVDGGGARRYGDVTRVLDEFMRHYRDQAGDVAPMPWER